MSKFVLLFFMVFCYGIYATITMGPVYGFYLYELIYFLNPQARWWGNNIPGISYSFIVVLLTLAMFVFQLKSHTQNTLKNTPETKWFIAVFLSFCVVSFNAANSFIHNKFLFDLFKLYIIIFVMYRIIDSKDKLKLALLVYIIGCAYIGWEAFNVGRNADGRVEGIGTVDAPDANGTAAAIVPSIPLLLYFAWRLEWKWKIAIGLFGAFIANGLVLINSRGAFLGAITAGGFLLLHMMFSRYKLPRQRLMVTVILLLSLMAMVKVTDNSFWERMSTIQESSSTESKGSGGRRINFWLATFDLLEDHPLGVGIFGYQTLSPIYLTDDSYFTSKDGVKMRAVHSMWFQALSEIGWHGFFFFTMLLICIWRRLRQAKALLISRKLYEDYYLLVAIQSGLIGFLVAGTFIDAFRAEILYWFMIFCISAVAIVHNGEDNQDKTREENEKS